MRRDAAAPEARCRRGPLRARRPSRKCAYVRAPAPRSSRARSGRPSPSPRRSAPAGGRNPAPRARTARATSSAKSRSSGAAKSVSRISPSRRKFEVAVDDVGSPGARLGLHLRERAAVGRGPLAPGVERVPGGEARGVGQQVLERDPVEARLLPLRQEAARRGVERRARRRRSRARRARAERLGQAREVEQRVARDRAPLGLERRRAPRRPTSRTLFGRTPRARPRPGKEPAGDLLLEEVGDRASRSERLELGPPRARSRAAFSPTPRRPAPALRRRGALAFEPGDLGVEPRRRLRVARRPRAPRAAWRSRHAYDSADGSRHLPRVERQQGLDDPRAHPGELGRIDAERGHAASASVPVCPRARRTRRKRRAARRSATPSAGGGNAERRARPRRARTASSSPARACRQAARPAAAARVSSESEQSARRIHRPVYPSQASSRQRFRRHAPLRLHLAGFGGGRDARKNRKIRGLRADRCRRLRRRLPGPGPVHQAHGRDQDLPGQRRRDQAPLLPRGRARRQPPPPQHHHDLRLRRRERHPLHRPGVPDRRGPRQEDQARRSRSRWRARSRS